MRAKLADIEMTYAVIGSGKPIVLLHGLGLEHGIWLEMAEQYENQAQFILPDLRGHGLTGLGQADGSLEQMADDIYALISELGLEQVILGGHSMGGYVALAFAEKYPHRLAGLAMIASNAGKDSPEKRAQRYLDAEAILKEGSIVLAKPLSLKLSNDADIQTQTSEIIAACPDEGLANAQLAIAQRPEKQAVLDALACRLLVVHGAEDSIIPLQASQAMARTNPQARLVVINGVGHMPMMEAPECLGALLLTL